MKRGSQWTVLVNSSIRKGVAGNDSIVEKKKLKLFRGRILSSERAQYNAPK